MAARSFKLYEFADIFRAISFDIKKLDIIINNTLILYNSFRLILSNLSKWHWWYVYNKYT